MKVRTDEVSAAYAAANDALQRYRELETKISEVQRAVPELEAGVTAAEERLRRALVNVRLGRDGQATVDEARDNAAQAKSALQDALDALAEAERPGGRRAELSAALHSAKNAAAAARRRYTEEVVRGLTRELRADQKLRERLDAIYAAMCSANDPAVGALQGQILWDAVLVELLPAPDELGLEVALARFGKEHPLPTLG